MVSQCVLVLLGSYVSATLAFHNDPLASSEVKQQQSSILIGHPLNEVKLDKYFTLSELDSLLSELERNHTGIVRVTSIGQTAVDKEQIRAVQISHDVQQERKLLKPMFKYVANMHGDETVGYALMVSLIQYLVFSDGVDQRITRMLDTTDIWIIPTFNPDGLKRAEEGLCFTPNNMQGRANGNGVDLNRNFPDQFVNNADKTYEAETLEMMDFIKRNPFVLSANLHGGAIVANYPFDDSNNTAAPGSPSLAPDNDFFVQLALDYASRNPMMAHGNACDMYSFENGITNGNAWYPVVGGMQDFNYVQSNCFEITLEVSCCKYPKPSELPSLWDANLESLLNYIEHTRRGVYGLVTDKLGNPIAGAVIEVRGIGKNISVTERGEYWRLLVPGEYHLTASAASQYRAFAQVDVTIDDPYVRYDFILE